MLVGLTNSTPGTAVPYVQELGVLALLTGWGATASVQARRLAAEQVATEQAAERAQNNFALLVRMLEAADPAVAGDKELTAKQVLATASATLDAEKFSGYFFDCPIFTIPGRLCRGRACSVVLEGDDVSTPTLQERSKTPLRV